MSGGRIVPPGRESGQSIARAGGRGQKPYRRLDDGRVYCAGRAAEPVDDAVEPEAADCRPGWTAVRSAYWKVA